MKYIISKVTLVREEQKIIYGFKSENEAYHIELEIGFENNIKIIESNVRNGNEAAELIERAIFLHAQLLKQKDKWK